MILEVIWVVLMLLWGLSSIPYEPLAPFTRANALLGFLAVLVLGLFIFVPGLRG